MEEGQRRGGMEWEAMYPKVSFHPTPLWEVWVPDSAAPNLELSACLFWCSLASNFATGLTVPQIILRSKK